MTEMNYKGPGVYRHYKGGRYGVLGLALQEDTVRKPDQPEHDDAGPERVFVIYQPLDPGSLLESRGETFWARDLEDFNDHLTIENEIVPRFELIGHEALAEEATHG